MKEHIETLVRGGRILEALRALFEDESQEAVEEFVSAAENEPRLNGICLLFALELADQDASDHSLLILEEVLRRGGMNDEARRVGALIGPVGPSVRNAIDTVISGESLTEEARQSVIAEYRQKAPLEAEELRARKESIRALRERLK